MIFEGNARERFDHVILDTDANTALPILERSASDVERETLKHFHTTENVCVLHSDESVSISAQFQNSTSHKDMTALSPSPSLIQMASSSQASLRTRLLELSYAERPRTTS